MRDFLWAREHDKNVGSSPQESVCALDPAFHGRPPPAWHPGNDLGELHCAPGVGGTRSEG